METKDILQIIDRIGAWAYTLVRANGDSRNSDYTKDCIVENILIQRKDKP